MQDVRIIAVIQFETKNTQTPPFIGKRWDYVGIVSYKQIEVRSI
jgi:hypothetical protein